MVVFVKRYLIYSLRSARSFFVPLIVETISPDMQEVHKTYKTCVANKDLFLSCINNYQLIGLLDVYFHYNFTILYLFHLTSLNVTQRMLKKV